MDVPRLHFVLARASQIPTGSVTSVQTPERDIWVLDGAQIDERLAQRLCRVARTIQTSGILRDTPRDDPWGEMRLVREDISMEEMTESWEITPAGIYIPVPRKLATLQLIREMAAHGTEYLRYVDHRDIELGE